MECDCDLKLGSSADIPSNIKEIQNSVKGEQHIIMNINGVLHQYIHDDDLFLSRRFTRKIKAEIDWFENIINHKPTIGTFYENILKNTLLEFLPSKFKIGTGFIYDLDRRTHSKQIDILIYNDTDIAPIYRNGDFVVVAPKQVVSLIEVKKTLRAEHLKNIIDKTFFSYFGTDNNSLSGVQYINIFAYTTKIAPKKILKILMQNIEKKLLELITQGDENENKNHFAIEHIVLPRIFFLKDKKGYFINSNLVSDEFGYKIEITLANSSQNEGSLGELFSYTIPHNSEKDLWDERNSLSWPIHNYEEKLTSNESIRLIDTISMLELLNHFTDDHDQIVNFKIDGSKPYAITISKKTNWKDFKNFSTLLRVKTIRFSLIRPKR